MFPLDVSVFDDGPDDVERCGLILQGPDRTWHVHELPNRHPDPHNHFAIDTDDADPIPASEGFIVGAVHTHPRDAEPFASQHDVDSIPEGWIGLVYHPATGSKVWYDSTGVQHEDFRRKQKS